MSLSTPTRTTFIVGNEGSCVGEAKPEVKTPTGAEEGEKSKSDTDQFPKLLPSSRPALPSKTAKVLIVFSNPCQPCPV